MLRRSLIRQTLSFLFLMLLAPAIASAQLKVVATTEDLGSLAREIGGDKVSVTSLAKGYQDPHFVDPKPSFILAVSRADLLIVVGRELEIGWLPPLLTSSRNAKIQPGAEGYLDASLNVRILEIPTGQITRAMGDVHPLGNPHYWLEPGNGRRMAQAIRDKLSELSPNDKAVLRAALRRFRQAAGGGREAMGRGDGAVQGDEDRHLSPLVAELHGALRPGGDGLRRTEAGHSAVAVAHA